MAAVDVAGLAVFHVIGEQRRQLASPSTTHTSCAMREARLAAPNARARRCTWLGMSCTSVPPIATFSTCMPRQIARKGMPLGDRGARQRDLERVAAGLGGLERGVRRLAVQRRVDVAAAGQHQAVDARQDLLGRLRRRAPPRSARRRRGARTRRSRPSAGSGRSQSEACVSVLHSRRNGNAH